MDTELNMQQSTLLMALLSYWQVEGGNPSPLFSTCKAVLRVLCPGFGS